jgi:hypothetical protein
MSSVPSQSEKGFSMGSIQKQGDKILGMISKVDAERLLTEWANISEKPIGQKLVSRMCSRYPEVFAAFDQTKPNWWGSLSVVLSRIQVDLRNAWDAPEQRQREWKLFILRQSYHDAVVLSRLTREGRWEHGPELTKLLSEAPPLTSFEAAIYYFQKISDRAKHCGNESCPAHYFIAVNRWQKFCSDACAGPVNREQKRRWWHENKGKGLL